MLDWNGPNITKSRAFGVFGAFGSGNGVYAYLLCKEPKLDLRTFLRKLLDIFGCTRKVIGFICTAWCYYPNTFRG